MEKIIDIEDRIPTLKERRRRRTNKKFSILLFLFVSTLLIVLYFQSSYSQVQKISLAGASLVPKEQYIEQSTLKIGDSMWGFREKKIEEMLEKNEWIKSVNIKRKWLTEVQINIEEYKQIGYQEDGDSFQVILENGKSMNLDGQVFPFEGPIFTGFEDEEIRIRLIRELKKLNSEVLQTISQINYTPSENDKYSIQVFMNDGNEVQAMIPSFSEKMNFYPSIISQIEPGVKGVIDMEVGSFFHPYIAIDSEQTDKEGMEGEESETP